MSPAEQKRLVLLPEIPRKRYFAIGEVSELCDVKPHVLRYWEQEFPQLKPVKRRGNRRYYQQDDVQMVRRIRSLLYEQGFTIGGARQRLKEAPRSGAGASPAAVPPKQRSRKAEINRLRNDLESLLRLLPEA
jgi:DNA-binding transcriptional MerR regulator